MCDGSVICCINLVIYIFKFFYDVFYVSVKFLCWRCLLDIYNDLFIK